MKFWINKESSVSNVLILAKNGLLIADCKEELVEAVSEKLKNKTHPLEIFSKDDTHNVRFRDLTRIVSRNSDCDINFYYKPAKEEKDIDYSFEDEASRQACLKVLELILPENLQKTVTQQSAIVAALPPIGSLLVAIVSAILYFNIYRWLTIIIGGIWVLGSLYMVYFRYTKPPEVTRWNIKGKYISKTWGNLKAFAGYLSFAAFVVGYAWLEPAKYGPQAIVENMENEVLEPKDIDKLVSRGGDVNYKNENGNAPLHLAIEWDETQLIPALIEHGAETMMLNSDDLTPLMLAISEANEDAIEAILDTEKPVGSLKGAMPWVVSRELSLGVIDKLRARGLDINELNEDGQNSLQLALYASASRELVEGLLERGVSVDFDMDGQSIEKFLEENDREDLRDLFIINEIDAR